MAKFLFDENPLVINTTLARTIGLNEAIVIQQIHYWLEINKKSGNNLIDGMYWTYNTVQKWHEDNFDFMSLSTVKRALNSLGEKNLLITGNYNKLKMDRTLWYTINYIELEKVMQGNKVENALGQNEQMHDAKMGKCIESKRTNGEGQIDPMHSVNLTSPIPETTTETNTEITTETTTTTTTKEEKAIVGVVKESDLSNLEFKDVIESFNNNIHPVTSLEAEKLLGWLEDMSKDIVIYAIEAAVMGNGRNMNYINKVLNNLINSGVKDKQGLDAYIRDYEDKKNRQIAIKQGNPAIKQSDEYGLDINKLINDNKVAREAKSKELAEKYKDWKPSDWVEEENSFE